VTDPTSLNAILSRWRAGDQGAASVLYGLYAERLCALAQAQMSPPLARRVGAEDVVQSVFRTFFRRAGEGQFTIDHENELWRLLVHVTLCKIRTLAEHHQAQRRDLRQEAAGEDQRLELAVADPTPSEVVALAEELDGAMKGLEESELAVVRRCLEGHAVADIAAEVGCSRWTVRRVLDRVGNRLQERLQAVQ